MTTIYLHDLLKRVHISPTAGFVNPKIKSITFNSKQIEKGTLFLGLCGSNIDGGIYWKDAIKNGAVAAIISEEAWEITGLIESKYVLVLKSPLNLIFGKLISEFFDRPSSNLKLIGVTGTNGKTTVTFLLEYILDKLGKKVALFGTLFSRWPGHKESSHYTTDFADKLQFKLFSALKSNVEFVVMEVSSHSISQGRIAGCEFDAAIFTNLSQDHLDYHSDMKSYFDTKMSLFKHPYLSSKEGFSVINIDDNWGKELLNNLKSEALIVSSQDSDSKSNNKNYFFVTDKVLTTSGTHCLFHTPNEKIQLFIPLVGEFNLMNALQSIITLFNLGFPLRDICNAIKTFPGVPGRMEIIRISEENNRNVLPDVIVDYAHTPDGLSKVLESLKVFSKGKIITVFGCGGDRDIKKRALMGSIAEIKSDFIFVTSDNPRTEKPEKIVGDILSGIRNKEKVIIEFNRSKSIQKAINMAKVNDIVLIAGKGHEDYQILKNKTIKFDDREVAKYFLNEKIKNI